MPKTKAKEREEYWTLKYRSYEPEYGYNIRIGDNDAWYDNVIKAKYNIA